MYLTVFPSEFLQGTLGFSLFQKLEETLKVETRGGPAEDTLPYQLQGQEKRVKRADVLNRINSFAPGKLDRCEQCEGPWARNSVTRSSAYTKANTDVSDELIYSVRRYSSQRGLQGVAYPTQNIDGFWLFKYLPVPVMDPSMYVS